MKKQIISALFFFALTAMDSAQPMGKTFAKKAFEKTCTAVGFGIAAGPLWYNAAQRLIVDHPKEEISEKLIDANPIVTDFCRKELVAMRIDPAAISIKVPEIPIKPNMVDPINARSFRKTIVIDYPEEIEFIVKETQEAEAADEKSLAPIALQKKHAWQKTLHDQSNKWRYVVQHEATHVKNNDTRNIGIAAGVIPLVSHAGFSLLRRKAPLSTLGHLKKIPAGIGKLVVNGGVVSQYSKYREQEADNGVSENRDILKGGYEMHKDMHENLTAFLEKTFYDHPDAPPAIGRGARTLLYNLADPNHPTPLVRMQKFEERIKRLEKSETTTTRKI